MPARNPAREDALHDILARFDHTTLALVREYKGARGERKLKGFDLHRLLYRDTITAIYAATRPTRPKKVAP